MEHQDFKHILFVDDESPITDSTKQVLEQLGFLVTATTSSHEALAAFQAYPEQFDLVITDYHMPVMSGLELAAELQQIRRNIPIILCSGHKVLTPEEARELGIFCSIRKPIHVSALSDVIYKALKI